MKKYFWVFLAAALIVSCGGYKEKSNPLSAEEVQISDMAAALENDATVLQQLAPAGLKDSADAFVAATERFQNYSLRFGANALESRKAFDQIMFVEAQITQSPDLQSNPDFNTKWQELRKGRLMELAKKLGYRQDKFQD